jgi:translation initiation factor IF-2
MAKKYENIEKIGKLISDGSVGELNKKIGQAEKNVSDILKKLTEMENAISAKKEEERLAKEQAVKEAAAKEQAAKEAAEKAAADKAAKDAADKVAADKAAKEAAEKVAADKAAKDAADKVAADKAAKEQAAKVPAEKPVADKPATEQTAAFDKKPNASDKPFNKEPVKSSPAKEDAPRTGEKNTFADKNNFADKNTRKPLGAKPQGDKPQGERFGQDRYNQERSGERFDRSGDRFGDRTGDRRSDRPNDRRPAGAGGNTFVNRDSQRPAPRGDRPPRTANGTYNGAYNGTRPAGAGFNSTRPAQGTRTGQGGFGTRPQGQSGFRSGMATAASAAVTKPTTKNFGADKKKQSFDKTYVEKDKHPVSKRALQKQQGASISDFDEDKSGYRKLRVKKDKKAQATQTVRIEKAVVTTNEIPLKVLSEKLGISAVEITKRLFKDGIMKTVNESIDYDTAALLAAGLGIELEYKPEKTAEDILIEKQADTVEEIESLVPRAPIVTVMGHVDHGKTSLLDYIRKTKVTAGEAGGITQHIGAYSVSVNGKSITFLDTPGHEAFTAMRARGAQVTDIVILVVAADDGVMPQTVEAINHAKAAGVSIVVAVNKMDKVGADVERVKQDLTNYGLVPEEWGGDTAICPISCKTGQGIDELLENVLLVAEMKELLANPAREARGTIIEAQLDKGKGPVASVLVQNGTLRTGDNIVTGTITGRVRAMIDDKGRTVKEAGPSMAVFVLGLEEVPNAGDSIFAVSQDLMKQVTDERKRKESDARVSAQSKISLDEVFGKIAEGNMKSLNLIIKGDVQGSVEAVKGSVLKLSNEEVQVKVIHSGAGAINESDVMLADSSNAIILGFNVRPDAKAKTLAERSKVDIRTYRIIYDLLDDMQAALKGMLTPKYQEVYLGKCEVRQTFKITGVGNIAGCYVLDGKIVRGGKLRIYRDDVLIVEGNVQQLKRFKEDAREVAAGYECGCAIEGFNDIKIGDIIECYQIEQIKQ